MTESLAALHCFHTLSCGQKEVMKSIHTNVSTHPATIPEESFQSKAHWLQVKAPPAFQEEWLAH